MSRGSQQAGWGARGLGVRGLAALLEEDGVRVREVFPLGCEQELGKLAVEVEAWVLGEFGFAAPP